MDKLKLHTPDLTAANIEKLAALFPSCITEARDEKGVLKRAIDFDQLRQELSDHTVEGPRERYHLDWPGKREALLAANAPIAKTLRPCREESVDFDTTKNLFIEGDNLDALKLLQETYLGKVKMIYIDPPYNTGSDLLYDDDFGEPNKTFQFRSEQRDEVGNRLVMNPESNGRFHSDWLTMLYPRLKLARNLLRDDGVIFISIDDNEAHSLRTMCDELFGSANFVGCIARKTKLTSNKGTHFAPSHEYIVAYARDILLLPVFNDSEAMEDQDYLKLFRFSDDRGKFNEVSLYMPSLDPMRGCANQRYFIECPDGTFVIPPGETMPQIAANGSGVAPESSKDKVWRWTFTTFQKNLSESRVVFKETKTSPLLDADGKQARWNIYTKIYLNERQKSGMLPNTFFDRYPNSAASKLLLKLSIPFPFSKPFELIKWLMKISGVNSSDMVADLFAGSAATAHAVMAFNNEECASVSFLMVQIPEPCDEKSDAFKAGFANIADIGKERIRRSAALLNTEPKLTTPAIDSGFRVLKIDTSNMADVYYAPDAVKQADLVAHTDNIMPDRTPEDLLFQVLVDWGVDLSLPITQETIAKKKVFFVDGDALAACFDPKVSEDLVKELAKRKPLRAVFRDSSYDSDSVKINVEQIFKLLSPETEVKSL